MIHNAPPDDEYVPWDMTQFSGAFLIWFMMLFAANVAFILESTLFAHLKSKLNDKLTISKVLFKHTRKDIFSKGTDMYKNAK